jgi:hypothetical protein
MSATWSSTELAFSRGKVSTDDFRTLWTFLDVISSSAYWNTDNHITGSRILVISPCLLVNWGTMEESRKCVLAVYLTWKRALVRPVCFHTKTGSMSWADRRLHSFLLRSFWSECVALICLMTHKALSIAGTMIRVDFDLHYLLLYNLYHHPINPVLLPGSKLRALIINGVYWVVSWLLEDTW